MQSVLVRTYGFMGDVLFAGSLAKKLSEQGYDKIVYLNGQPHVSGFLERNPYINEVINTHTQTPNTHNIPINQKFDKEVFIPETTFLEPPPVQFQKAAGITHPSPDFVTYTNPEFDKMVQDNYKISSITIMEPKSWELKSFLFTKEQYEAGIDVPQFGYGGAHRNIYKIISGLDNVIFVGNTPGTPSSKKSLELCASLIKFSQAFIGAEGGLANIAAGCGVKTILTSDFVHQLYGWNGVMSKHSKEPKLGPRYYFPEAGHIDLDPYFTDEEVRRAIRQCLI